MASYGRPSAKSTPKDRGAKPTPPKSTAERMRAAAVAGKRNSTPAQGLHGTIGRRKGGGIRWRCHYRNTIHDVFASMPGWREMPKDAEGLYIDSDEWDCVWSDRGWVRDNYDGMRLREGQRVNHFRNNYELTRKDHCAKNLKRAKKQHERDGTIEAHDQIGWDFFPPTYVVPSEYGLFYEEFKRNPNSVWIMKPVGSAQGKGIFLFTKLSQISDWKKDYAWKPGPQAGDKEDVELYIAQRYIENPYLIGGKKFDMRIYCLVTCFHPLTVWIYRSGFARFSNFRFSMKRSEVKNNLIHLTNVAVQKTADEYGEFGAQSEEDGSKWDLRNLKLFLASRHGMSASNKCFNDIQDVMLKTLKSVEKVMINDKHCFELYGYDVLIDAELKPWLIEVNSSPALTASSKDDYDLKFGMLTDTLTVIDLEHKLEGTETQIGGYDLVWCDGEVATPANGLTNGRTTADGQRPEGLSNLGSFNNREENLAALYKRLALAKKAAKIAKD